MEIFHIDSKNVEYELYDLISIECNGCERIFEIVSYGINDNKKQPGIMKAMVLKLQMEISELIRQNVFEYFLNEHKIPNLSKCTTQQHTHKTTYTHKPIAMVKIFPSKIESRVFCSLISMLSFR